MDKAQGLREFFIAPVKVFKPGVKDIRGLVQTGMLEFVSQGA
jgi:hypothetical protein